MLRFRFRFRLRLRMSMKFFFFDEVRNVLFSASTSTYK